ncbi:MAG: UbiD family decarboxylase [Lentisphaeraceae bacterium]|nr:UbiD family decarboxylase [Lentisphaeraceae bacterium]
MGYRSTKECVDDLEKHGHLIRIKEEIDPDLEIAEIQRRVYEKQGPAILFEKVKSSPFPCVSNLFGTADRTKFIFRDTYTELCALLSAKADPSKVLKSPSKLIKAVLSGWKGLPKKVSNSSTSVMQNETSISQLPQIKSWPDDGGAFITLPQVYSEHPDQQGKPLKSNLGMYRVQLSGNEYEIDKEIGLHYQIHRGIGVHHKLHNDQNKPFKVAIFVGGPPANTFSAVMPLPEGMPEVAFGGLLSGNRFHFTKFKDWTLAADADFCIIGTISNSTKPEGPFGDHLGYYSLKHDFPCLGIEKVFHRNDAIWPFTVVGRPPQEDTSFGQVIHDMTASILPTEINGLKAVHAVDATGVHPLLLAIGEERYTPYKKNKRPQELMTIANAILGKGQLSLAKYLFIVDEADDKSLDIHNIDKYITHLLERIDFSYDLHFQTHTTIDTLDYSGTGVNDGSKVIFSACGEKKNDLKNTKPELTLPRGFDKYEVPIAGTLAIRAPKFTSHQDSEKLFNELSESLKSQLNSKHYPLIVIVDDAEFCKKSLNNFLWVTFTRSNPSHDIYGVDSFTEFKHWGCRGSLIIDARIKPHHAPPLVEDPEVTARVDKLFEDIPQLKALG